MSPRLRWSKIHLPWILILFKQLELSRRMIEVDKVDAVFNSF